MIPFTCDMGLCLSNCPTQRNGLLFPTYAHTQNRKQKEKLKLQTPKTVLRKLKEGKTENQQEKTEINNI